MTDRERPILLKKSALISTVEKYALEIEIVTLSRGFRVQISRSGAPKTFFQRSVCGRSGRTDFFNRIGQERTLAHSPISRIEALTPLLIARMLDQVINERPCLGR